MAIFATRASSSNPLNNLVYFSASVIESIIYSLNINEIERYCRKHLHEQTPISTPKISVIILSFNRFPDTRRALHYLYKNTPVSFELVVLDNGSSKDTVTNLTKELKKYPNVKLLLEKENLGAAKGKFKAAQAATGDYLMFIDNDMIVMPFYLENLLKRLISDRKLVAVCAKVVYPNKRIQFTGGNFEIKGKFVIHGLINYGKVYNDDSGIDQHETSDWIPGGATLWKRNLYFKFPIDRYMDGSYEDNEVCMRIRKAGLLVGNSQRAVCVHYHYTFKPKAFLKTEKKYLSDRYHEGRLITGLVRYYEIHKLIFAFATVESTWPFLKNHDPKTILRFIRRKAPRSRAR